MVAVAVPKKTMTERVLQAVAFEVLAVASSTVLFAWVMGTTWVDMGVLSLADSLVAMVWNVVYNAAFDRMRTARGFEMSILARIAHATGFECGLLVATLPLAMGLLDLGFRAAAALEAAGLLYFLVYTYAFTWAYDALREVWGASAARAPPAVIKDPP